MTNSSRRAFTLVELLVVIAIIGILVSLLLPAVQGSRESGRRLQCANKIRQLALANRSYLSTHNSFPPGVPSCVKTENLWIQGGTQTGAWCQGPNWLLSLFPYMEQTAIGNIVRSAMSSVYNTADDLEHYGDDIGRPEYNIGNQQFEFMLCPSADTMSPGARIDTYEHDAWIAKGNYAGSWGSNDYMSWEQPTQAGMFGVVQLENWKKISQQENGAGMLGEFKLGYGRGTKEAHVTDGLSNTLLISEVRGYNSSVDGRGGWILNAMGSSNFTARTLPNSIENDVIPMCDRTIEAGNRMRCQENRRNGQVWAAARSQHIGGVNAAMADGSTRFVTDDIDLPVWRAMSTRAGHDYIGP